MLEIEQSSKIDGFISDVSREGDMGVKPTGAGNTTSKPADED